MRKTSLLFYILFIFVTLAMAQSQVSVSVSPATVTLTAGKTQQFSATVSGSTNHEVVWSASAGTISSAGLWQSPTVTANKLVTIKATSKADPLKYATATATVLVATTAVSVAVTPTSASLASAKTQQFAATVSGNTNAAVVWSSTLGTISSAGLFTAPTVTSTVTATVKATSVADATKSASATVTISPSTTTVVAVTVTPTSAALLSGQSQPFTSTVTGSTNTAVTWTATAGTISASGVYVAPTVTTTTAATIKATSAADVTKSVSVSVSIAPASSTTSGMYDIYGGVNTKVSTLGATGEWRVEKFKNHWLLVTPAGHGFWMKGVFYVGIDTHTDDLGSDYKTRILAKYGNLTNWAYYTNKRLQSWGFNTLAEYSMTYNANSAQKMPFVMFFRPARYALFASSYTSSPTKDLIPGSGAYYKGYRGGTVPDVFDPGFAAYANGAMSGTFTNNPWMIGFAIDDSDGLYGFGPGPDAPCSHTSVHIGWLALMTNPQQTSNTAFNVLAYADTKVYTKAALANFLQTKYGTISALNAAWGSNYTTFGTAGGWGVGSGLLDEDGRHAWLGTDSSALSNASAKLKTDLDAFLFLYAKQYFSVVTAATRKYAPGKLIMGPATLNGWGGVSRQQVLQAAGQYLDIIQASVATQQVVDLTAQATGDKPLITWEGAVANSDSALWRYTGGLASQSARGQWYQSSITRDFNAKVTSTGSQPVVGMKFWALTDSWPEKANWGLVTLSDNAYDGVEATVGGTVDALGFKRGGEERNYGNFLGTVKVTNTTIDKSVQSLP